MLNCVFGLLLLKESLMFKRLFLRHLCNTGYFSVWNKYAVIMLLPFTAFAVQILKTLFTQRRPLGSPQARAKFSNREDCYS